jgi:Methyltransferase domain
MLGVPLRYLAKHPASVAELVADPFQVLSNMQDVFVAQRENRGPQCPYQADLDWEQRLHSHLGIPLPCTAAAEFWDLWPRVIAEMTARGIQAGPKSFGSWNDGDAGFVRAIWCLIRHLRPEKVIETGVAHGLSSRFILEAFARNESGHLWSIDLPPIEAGWKSHVGIAVTDCLRHRWTYMKGSSRRRLPSLLAELKGIDFFIHDSLHSERNVRFELDRAWAALTLNGAAIVDDVDSNWGFSSFTKAFPRQHSMVCEAEPLRPDLRRFNQKGLFGIILKSGLVS